ncbi:3-phosphoserine/phosphohydroxythreonine transaminase [Litorivicinus lipolyticus]|uniref:Phosphoserine aminotransferase n=1 Tax=Litorivicinus lipolyticus TaxID=418701 RepID=A0A5Q2QAK4_9GAMM|nr:3-phosphoserine/phosphohydroxythreonine transaminase [Litorivicinus lipolyticus]QGG80054.1 3-phosphoserine/phosphohydroxythreonine transaminase [Litorivicinus lipolyticus]
MRTFNFSAGPAGLPLSVLESAQAELLDWQGLGTSVMEISHRDPRVIAVFESAQRQIRELLAVPDDYAVIFAQGGASAMFDLIPQNLSPASVHVLNTGAWSEKAIKGAQRHAAVTVTGAAPYVDVPALSPVSGVDYLHYCHNETIHGVRVADIGTHQVPVVCDASSSIFSEAIDWSRHDLVYAGAQKNLGPSGVCLVIAKRSLLNADAALAPVFNFAKLDAEGSMVNTPPVFAVYLIEKVLAWITQRGGVSAMKAAAQRRSTSLYAAIDQSDFYSNPVAPAARSWMNVPFLLANPDLDAEFVRQSEAQGLMFLKGHRSVGGMRASLYNALPDAAVPALIQFMQHFEATRA